MKHTGESLPEQTYKAAGGGAANDMKPGGALYRFLRRRKRTSWISYSNFVSAAQM